MIEFIQNFSLTIGFVYVIVFLYAMLKNFFKKKEKE